MAPLSGGGAVADVRQDALSPPWCERGTFLPLSGSPSRPVKYHASPSRPGPGLSACSRSPRVVHRALKGRQLGAVNSRGGAPTGAGFVGGGGTSASPHGPGDPRVKGAVGWLAGVVATCCRHLVLVWPAGVSSAPNALHVGAEALFPTRQAMCTAPWWRGAPIGVSSALRSAGLWEPPAGPHGVVLGPRPLLLTGRERDDDRGQNPPGGSPPAHSQARTRRWPGLTASGPHHVPGPRPFPFR
ncbi:hypothetical protein GWK47_024046 [Chionoecetes opilio]|uniref:Uncharacterized protein n=1 Tax=Chionoecetes opilio TaxID=41210 RepID=A0A8J5CJF1_CHIOP|nr:hypothetical protein GWK47_024046 [Chionoecetes opilio]